uniref:Uncharacterized protein n=1 Tax=Oryza punctata TaxID=4537 RepID=A0A0E0L8A5_ORYPU
MWLADEQKHCCYVHLALAAFAPVSRINHLEALEARTMESRDKPEYSSPLADADTSFTFLVIGCNGRSVSVGESKLLHRCWPSGSMITRFPLLRSSAQSARVAVVLSRRAKVPSFWKVSLEPLPFTGASRFAFQATIFSDDLENQMEKVKALVATL